jgi:hypothetical protein
MVPYVVAVGMFAVCGLVVLVYIRVLNYLERTNA